MDNHQQLREYVEQEFKSLLRSIELYVLQFGIAEQDSAFTTAMDVLNDTVVDALEHAERFDNTRSPRAWLIGISLNIIKRRRSELYKRQQREPLILDMFGDKGLAQDELFELVSKISMRSAAGQLDDDESIQNLLAGIAESDQHIIRLAILHEMNGDALASELGISSGAARVRLHRALQRLRQVHGIEAKVNDYE